MNYTYLAGSQSGHSSHQMKKLCICKAKCINNL